MVRVGFSLTPDEIISYPASKIGYTTWRISYTCHHLHSKSTMHLLREPKLNLLCFVYVFKNHKGVDLEANKHLLISLNPISVIKVPHNSINTTKLTNLAWKWKYKHTLSYIQDSEQLIQSITIFLTWNMYYEFKNKVP